MRVSCHEVHTQELLQLYGTCRESGERAVKNLSLN